MSPALGMDVRGGGQLLRGFVVVSASAPRRNEKNLRRVAESVMTEAKRLAPVDTGGLQGSGYVRKAGDQVLLLGFAKDYALFVHEIPPPEGPGAGDPPQFRPGFRRARHDPPTQWKFLEKPARARFGKIEQDWKGRNSPIAGVRWPRFR